MSQYRVFFQAARSPTEPEPLEHAPIEAESTEPSEAIITTEGAIVAVVTIACVIGIFRYLTLKKPMNSRN